jgi:hypothetical protein
MAFDVLWYAFYRTQFSDEAADSRYDIKVRSVGIWDLLLLTS